MIRVSHSKTQDEYRRQFFFISLVVVFSFFILALRLWYLQILNGEKWLRFSESNRIEAKRIPAIRGRILDRNGKVIADSEPSFDLKIVPGKLKPNFEDGLKNVQKILSWTDEDLQKVIRDLKGQNKNDYFTVKTDITRDEMAIVLANQIRLSGVTIEVVPSRKYIYGGLASHLLGYLGEIGKNDLQTLLEKNSEEYGPGEFWGLSGVEKMYEPALKGLDGIEPVIEDVWGREVRVDAVGGLLPAFQARQDKEGTDVVLTVDLDLQMIAEKTLEKKRGSVVAINPRSGEVLAMASSPSYEPGQFSRGVNSSYWRKMLFDPEHPLYNRSVQGVYPPASTFKAIMATAILEENIADPNEKVNCPGFYRIGREVKLCWKHDGHGRVNLKEAIQHSCDTYFYEMSRRLGIDRLSKYASLFGLGQKTGYPLSPEEKKGLVPTREWKQKVYKQPWVEGETLSVAIGQGYMSVTPLQMAIVYAAIANGGELVKPYVALRTQTYTGDVLENFSSLHGKKIDVKPENLEKVMSGLSAVVNEPGGTAFATVKSKIVKIAGKTGTAQVSGRKSGIKTKDHAWFVGYAPDDDPEILVSVLIEEGLHGSSAAGPIAKEIIEKYIAKKEGLDGSLEILEPVEEKISQEKKLESEVEPKKEIKTKEKVEAKDQQKKIDKKKNQQEKTLKIPANKTVFEEIMEKHEAD